MNVMIIKKRAWNYYSAAAYSLEAAIRYEDIKIKIRAEIHSKLGKIYKELAAITEDALRKRNYRKEAERNYLSSIDLNKKSWGDSHIYVAKK
ncbi:hypothetical protein HRE53_32990 (plasmid) [Acaryochloris sp. 'Moss Beach']|uniref:hypothetical protein n=1 Tax=Acaryochloris sp. 'Moss Beach' TaxID=2740837 RepID=UPI001F25A87A|nr:hypothetical protein [Acaryochloris sp. 'Moss Beach']UJB73370.1 hypothetical protein HRE53_32990 [Acaryochloris sp. 'Moss Beach']